VLLFGVASAALDGYKEFRKSYDLADARFRESALGEKAREEYLKYLETSFPFGSEYGSGQASEVAMEYGDYIDEANKFIGRVDERTGLKKDILSDKFTEYINEKDPRVRPPVIRKNFYTLTEDEKSDFFFALKEMKRLNTTEGRDLYGEDFCNYEELMLEHAKAALSKQCDKGHFGPAFFWFHRLYLLKVERSILAVTNTISSTLTGMPYWDSVMDLKRYGSYRKSPLFSDAYFGGEGNPDNGWAVEDGQFAGSDWEIQFSEDAELKNPYGLMRSPFNPNPSRRITRRFEAYCGFPWPEATEYAQDGCVKLHKGGIQEFVACLDINLHANPHFNVGGTWDSEEGVQCLTLQVPAWMLFVPPPGKEGGQQIAQFGQPGPAINQWSTGCIECPTDCTIGQDEPSDCFCYYKDRDDPFAAHQCLDGQVISKNFPLYGLGVMGDMADVAFSTNDPIFWVHHANVDRVLASWQVTNEDKAKQYYFSPSVWPPDNGKLLLECDGHALDDIVNDESPFTGLFPSIPADQLLTVRDAIEQTVPGESMPYEYDVLVGSAQAVYEASIRAKEKAGVSVVPSKETSFDLGDLKKLFTKGMGGK